MTTDEFDISRRRVLKRSAMATGALLVGGAAATGTAAAAGKGAGGVAYCAPAAISRGIAVEGAEWTIQHEHDSTFAVRSACDRGAEREMAAYRVYADDGSNVNLFVNARRHLNLGARCVVTDVEEFCGEGSLDHDTDAYDGTYVVSRLTFESAE